MSKPDQHNMMSFEGQTDLPAPEVPKEVTTNESRLPATGHDSPSPSVQSIWHFLRIAEFFVEGLVGIACSATQSSQPPKKFACETFNES